MIVMLQSASEGYACWRLKMSLDGQKSSINKRVKKARKLCHQSFNFLSEAAYLFNNLRQQSFNLLSFMSVTSTAELTKQRLHSGRNCQLWGHQIYIESFRLKVFDWKRSIESVRLKAFGWKPSIESDWLKAFDWKRSIESVRLKVFDWKRSIESVQLKAFEFDPKHTIESIWSILDVHITSNFFHCAIQKVKSCNAVI